jgi:DNA-binding PadR family transcriptional regulator
MEYTGWTLTNVEFALLQIIHEMQEVCGYEIDQLIKERGYREWAGIGTTSIYTGLERLRKKQIVNSYIDVKKEGKGPLPKKFKITRKGEDILREEVFAAISSCRRRDQSRFELGIAGIPLLTTMEVISALNKRKESLLKVTEHIEEKFAQQGGDALPLNVRALFKHPLSLIKCEVEFIDTLIEELNKSK